MPKKVGKYEIHKTLGEGTFGKVKRALNSETQEWVAIKILDKEKIQKQNMGAQVKKEISIMKLVRHPHVVQLKEVLASRTKIFIVLELVTGGELFDKIVAEGRFKEKTARFYFQQLCVGTEYCHRQGVCHRDLKPENLLLDDNANLKISDFGLSALYEQDQENDRQALLHTTCGTPNYVAPEVLADQGYDGTMADTWSIGVILYVFLAGFLPFDEATMAALFRKIQKADFTYPSWFKPDVKDLLDKILVVNPKDRWSITDIMEHPWWKKDGPYAIDCNVDSTGLTHVANPPTPGNGGGGASTSEINETSGSSTNINNGAKGSNNTALNESAAVPVSGRMDVDDNMSSSNATENAAGTSGGASVVRNIDEQDHSLSKSKNDSTSKPSNEKYPKKINAFDLINLCSGSAINRMLQAGDDKVSRGKTLMYASERSATEIMNLIKSEFSNIPGHINEELKLYKSNSKMLSSFDFGRGQITVKTTIYIASYNPNLCLFIFKRTRGDLLSYTQNIGSRLNDICQKLGALPCDNPATSQKNSSSSMDLNA